MCVWCDSKMGFKRVMLNRLQIGSENKTLIAEMDENNDANDNANRKHTDFSIDKILSDDSARSSPTNLTPDHLYQKINNEYYAYWNRRIYPPPMSMMHPRRSAFFPTASTVTSATAHYEIMNLSLRMYDQQINLNNTVDRIRNSYAWTMPTSPSKLYDTSTFLSNLSNNNNNSNHTNNNVSNRTDSSCTTNSVQCNSKYSIYQNLKTYGIDLTNLSELNAQVNSSVATAIKSEPHTPENSGTSNLACSVCNKVFENALILDAHERTHKSPRYTCDECGKGFSQLRNYKYHVSVHKGTKEFAAKCPECDKLFNDKGYLSSHLKIHRNKKEYVCPNCPKSFNQRVAFNMHVRIHSGVKPHRCTECGKCFSRKMLLKQHLRTHSGEKPYQCSICLKSFADRSNMTLHQRLHSGIKPFACTICPKAFTKKHHLKTHLNYHIGCKPYVCPHPNCGKSFTQSSNMRTHSRKCEFRPPEQQQQAQQPQQQQQPLLQP